MSINKVILIGYLGKDVELKFTASKQAVTTLSLATSENYKQKDGSTAERTEWHKVVCWGKLAELCKKYLHTGKQIYVEGKLQTRSYDKDGQKHYTTEVVANSIEFLEGTKPVDYAVNEVRKIREAEKLAAEIAAKKAKEAQYTQQTFTTDDIPF